MGEKEHNHESKQMEQDQESSKDEKMRHGTALSAVEDVIKKDDDTIVLKVYMHCEACAKKVARSLKGFPGVEDVMANSDEGIVRVKGKGADPVKVYERVQAKSKRQVDLISPLPHPFPPKTDEKAEENNEQPPAATTTVLNVQMHCEACARVIRKKLLKIKGVEFATTDVSNNQAVVTGTIKPSELVKQLYKKTKKTATIVPPPPPPEEGQNKAAGEEKKDVENADTNHEGEGKDKEEEDKQEDVKRNQIWPTRHYTDYVRSYAYPPPPHIFSDENPNACCVM